MSNKTSNNTNANLENLDLEELLEKQVALHRAVEKKREARLKQLYQTMAEFLEANNIPLRQFLELGQSYYKNKKPTGSSIFSGLTFHDIDEEPKQPRKYGDAKALFCNPDNPEETWAGRGKIPRWMAPKLAAGAKKEDFLISKLNAKES